jgi:hypothetical protein
MKIMSFKNHDLITWENGDRSHWLYFRTLNTWDMKTWLFHLGTKGLWRIHTPWVSYVVLRIDRL